ncbi:MAG: hypothetical protein UW07_C0034G0001, partial [Candidatus Nomurabacteria bacterium GW2011_GWF2_43_8]
LLEEEKKQGTVTAPVDGKIISDIQEKLGTYALKGKFLLTRKFTTRKRLISRQRIKF